MGLLDWLSRGDERTAARDEWIRDNVTPLVPPNLRGILPFVAEMNPVQDVYRAGGKMRGGDYTGAAVDTAIAAAPVVGGVLGNVGAKTLAQGGDDAARGLMDAVLGYAPGRADALADGGRKFAADESGAMRLYHGSPHDFDKFSMDKIGTGEGAQAYGHGLYFAENEDVARGYRDALSGTRQMNPQTR